MVNMDKGLRIVTKTFHALNWLIPTHCTVDVLECDVAGCGADSTLDDVGCCSLSQLSKFSSRQSRVRSETGLTPTQI